MAIQITTERRKQLAEKHGINEQYLYQCLTGRRDLGPAEAMRLETETNKELTRQMLCQKTYASIWPDLLRLGDTVTPQADPEDPGSEHPKASDVVDRKELVALIEAGLVKDERQHVRRADDRARDAALKAGKGVAHG
ncbi:hypothetical protein SAMN05216344_102199 [Polaromonas sp. OV174]|uniref:hypothetical protein n=1 Tax=Polaromonas sp. OV174 TaxID=1855300 RepID=UPI0008E067A7|nr:hypothetical protein [Polaromonas sp. OV174]SFB74513.1 hypothetical protein SAMN05216344_102199 [Polaromonas sp. OV174]